MTNKKEILIKTLHGSLEHLKDLPQKINEETLYDDTGHVDLEFMTAILSWMSTNATIATEINNALRNLLGISDDDEKASKEDGGKSWSTEEILKNCTLENHVLKLPQVQFNKKSYSRAKQWIEEAGGSWQGGKVQGFTFPFNPERVVSILKEGKRCNLQQQYQFFETPQQVADWLVTLAGGIDNGDTVLEPSAGRGALVKAIHRACPAIVVDCYELMPENREFLQAMDGVRLQGTDFTQDTCSLYTKIIANPPFADNQDIDHVRLMYDRLMPGGTLASITSTHWKMGKEKKCESFRNWLEEIGGRTFDIDAGEFKESGTSIATMAIVINK